MEIKRCIMCHRRMLNEVQCSNPKCVCHKLPKELQDEYERQKSEGDEHEGEVTNE